MHVQLYALHSHHGVDVFGIIQRSTIVCTWSLVKCNCITLFKLICIFRSVVEKIIIDYMSSIFCSMSYQVSMVFWIIQKNKKLFLFSECNWLMRKNGTTSDFPFWNWSQIERFTRIEYNEMCDLSMLCLRHRPLFGWCCSTICDLCEFMYSWWESFFNDKIS